MAINGINGTNKQTAQMGMNQAMDSYSKNIQNQIANAQKQLQELSSNKEMTLEEKMKKRQEIQQQISDLNMQLRQHQMEQRRAAISGSEKQQAKSSRTDDMQDGSRNAKTGAKSTGLSQTSMTAMISANTSIKQAKVHGSVATEMKGRANVLKAEIKQSGSTEAKEAELADLEQKAVNATASQMNTLAEANKAVEEAAAERTDDKTSDTKEEKTTQTENTTAKKAENAAEGEKTQDGVSGTDAKTETVDSETQTAQATIFNHVDVRL